jgi:hypothetical protein
MRKCKVLAKTLYWTFKVHKFRLMLVALFLFFASYFCTCPSIGTFFICAFSFFASIELNVLILIGGKEELTSLIGTYNAYKRCFEGEKNG